MKPQKPTYKELETRLAQAEEILKAIRSGEVDVIIGVKSPLVVRAKAVEQALEESEKKYRSLVEQSLQGVLILQDFRIVFANKTSEEITGYTIEELFSLSPEKVMGLVHPEDQALVWGRFRERLAGKTIPPHYEYRGIRKDGSVRWIEMFASLIEYDGKPAVQAAILDITERKRVEKELREERDKFAKIVETAPGAICMFCQKSDGSTFFPYSSPAIEEVYGFKPEELAQDASIMEKRIHENDYARIHEEIMESARMLTPWNSEFRYDHPKKRQIWVSTRFLPKREEDGSTVWYGTVLDMTEQKKAEVAIRTSEAQLSNALKIAHLGHWEYEVASDLFTFNDPFYAIFRTTAEQEGGYTMSSTQYAQRFVHPEDRPIVGEEIKKALEATDPNFSRQLEHRIIYADGEIGYITVRFFIVKDDQGRTVKTYGVNQDITERKRAEELLRESEERFRNIAEAISEYIWETDAQARYCYVTKRMEAIYGRPMADLMGHKPFDFMPLEEARRMRKFISELALQKQPFRNVEHQTLRPNGTIFYQQVSGIPIIDKEGNLIGYRGTASDITERKKAEQEMASLQEQLRQSQRMEAIGRLAGGIAHDFNNLLTVIKGNCQLSLMDLKEGDPLKINLEEIQRAAESAAHLTRQLLAFSRKQIMEMKVIDLNTLIRNLEKMLRRVIGEDIELLTFLSDELGRVKVDPGQMEQAMMNLIVNARDAMPEGGKLTIETTNVELDEEYARRHLAVKPGSYVMLSISDTGVGMSPEVKERIFEPFFTTKEREKGTGLGLSTVYGIVKQSGGNIWVYSEPNQGTTFKVYLPRVDEPLEELREEAIREIPRGSETVLVVEDDETVRKLAVRLLRKQGYKVLEASDGGKALILCEQYKDPIHLILTDVVMPGMSGRQLVERLQKIHPESRELYMSGYTDNAILHHGVLEQGIEFVQKPFTLEKLARKVRQVLDKQFIQNI